jgi:RNA recognition motif-containing protein
VRIVRDDRTQRPKGYAFVRFESDAAAENAIKGMDKRVLQFYRMFLIEYIMLEIFISYLIYHLTFFYKPLILVWKCLTIWCDQFM